VLTVKKILAGRGAVDYYLNQTRRGLGDYYLPEGAGGGDGAAGLSAPGSSWWGGGAQTLALSGGVGRGEFEPLFTTAAHPDGGHLGRRFRLPDEAADAKAEALRAASEIPDAYERWMARHEIRRRASSSLSSDSNAQPTPTATGDAPPPTPSTSDVRSPSKSSDADSASAASVPRPSDWPDEPAQSPDRTLR
jgi:hypothetical protein